MFQGTKKVIIFLLGWTAPWLLHVALIPLYHVVDPRTDYNINEAIGAIYIECPLYETGQVQSDSSPASHL